MPRATEEVQVRFPVQHSRLRIWCCCRCDLCHSLGLDLILGPGTSICSEHGKKKFFFTLVICSLLVFPGTLAGRVCKGAAT